MAEYESPRIPGGGERPRSMIHADIYAAFQATMPAEAQKLADSYRQLSWDWVAGLEVFSTSIKRSVAAAWEGEAADAFVDSIHRYVDQAAFLETELLDLANRVSESASSVETTKHELPEPLEEKHALHPDSWPYFGTNRDPMIEQRQEEAQAIMENNYVTPFVRTVDPKVPVLSAPVNPTSPLDIGEPTTGKPVGPGGQPNSNTDNGTGDPNGPGATDTEEPGTEEPAPEDTGTEDGTEQESPWSPEQTQAPTGTEPADTGTPAPTTPASTTPAGVPGPGGPGSPAGAPGPGTPDSPGPGRTVPGTPGGAAPAPAAATAPSTTAAGAPRGGMGGMPMGAAGRGGQQEQDDQRQTPDYLVNMENTEELLGELPRTLPGGLIGTNPEPEDSH
ncbi:WXG100 family type VII secretion target [Nocardia carnea]|uniref:WXG100 family type VII secretion target n=1 Tax=Nocardia carnea TaxID=37328 RepID=A0ABW7U132_9NOCA|nr:WXG100 family type VII secretion target [Nocardia carnea]